MTSNNPIQERSFSLVLRIIDIYKLLIAEREFALSKQLLRSGTSIGANITEATAAISKREFAQKMSVASKKARESRYGLELLTRSGLTQQDLSADLEEINHLINILTAIVKTAQANLE